MLLFAFYVMELEQGFIFQKILGNNNFRDLTGSLTVIYKLFNWLVNLQMSFGQLINDKLNSRPKIVIKITPHLLIILISHFIYSLFLKRLIKNQTNFKTILIS